MPPPDMKEADPRRHNGSRPTRSVPISTITASIVSPLGIGVTAEALPPSGRRTCWLSIVRDCPFCRGAHVHRGDTDQPAADLRTAGCGRGDYYIEAPARVEAAS